MRAKLPPGVDGWGYSLKGMMGMVVTGGVLITGTYFLLQRTVVPKVRCPCCAPHLLCPAPPCTFIGGHPLGPLGDHWGAGHSRTDPRQVPGLAGAAHSHSRCL